MKRTALAIVLITVIALSVATWLVHNQISDLQNQIGDLQAQNSELQDQNSDLQEQIGELQLQNREKQDRLADFTFELAKERHLRVEITAFQWIGGFNPIGGLWLGHPVNVTVQNDDVVPLSGLKLWVVLAHENTGAEIGTGGITIDRLNAGESREIYIDAMSGPRTSLSTSLSSDAVCVIRLTAADVVLDEETYGLS
jgi:heme/copper-type cytochrome/quinol oxidase subunit 2